MNEHLSGPEKMFREELEAIGAKIEGVLIRTPRDWLPNLYGYRITKANGEQLTGFVPWNLNTFYALMNVVRGET